MAVHICAPRELRPDEHWVAPVPGIAKMLFGDRHKAANESIQTTQELG